MAWFRRLSALTATLLLAGAAAAAEPVPTAEAVIAKARAALAADPAALAKVKSVRMEFVAYDLRGAELNVTTLTLAQPAFRLQKTIEKNRQFETVVCAGRLEGWTTRRLDALASREVKAIPFEEFRKLQDMGLDDLAFFAAPPAGVGTVTLKGPSEVDGRRTVALEYAYAHGFRIVRHFDAETFALVASDQPTPRGELQRQKVESFATVDGVAFPAKESIYVDGKKSGEVTYGRVQVNPELPAGLFDFPAF